MVRDTTTLRFGFLVLAILIYGVLGSPTPDAPGWVEAAIAGFLMLGAGLPGFYAAFRPGTPDFLWMTAGRLLLIYGLSVCLISGAVLGNEPLYILRDALPFLFLVLPLFLADIFQK